MPKQLNNKHETRAFKATELRVSTDASTGVRTLEGYAAVFNSPSEDFGGWSERIDPGAFNRTLLEGADVRCLVEHDPALIVGRTKSKTLSLSVDQIGLRFRCQLPDTTVARDLVTSVERGDLDSCSFGFIAQKESWVEDSQANTVIRTLLDVDLLDTSVVCYPAYAATSVNVRCLPASMPTEIRSKVSKRDDDEVCECDCPQCMGGDCGLCSDDGCTDLECGCPNQRSTILSETEHRRIQIKLAILAATDL